MESSSLLRKSFQLFSSMRLRSTKWIISAITWVSPTQASVQISTQSLWSRAKTSRSIMRSIWIKSLHLWCARMLQSSSRNTHSQAASDPSESVWLLVAGMRKPVHRSSKLKLQEPTTAGKLPHLAKVRKRPVPSLRRLTLMRSTLVMLFTLQSRLWRTPSKEKWPRST